MGKTKNHLVGSGFFSAYRQNQPRPLFSVGQQRRLKLLVDELSVSPQMAINEHGEKIWQRLLGANQGIYWSQRLRFILTELDSTPPLDGLFAQLPAKPLDYQKLNQLLTVKRIDYFTQLLSTPNPDIQDLCMLRLVESFQEVNDYLQTGGDDYQPIIDDLELKISLTKVRIKELLFDTNNSSSQQQRNYLLKGLCFYDGLANSVNHLADPQQQLYNPLVDLQAFASGLANVDKSKQRQSTLWQQQEISWIGAAWPQVIKS